MYFEIQTTHTQNKKLDSIFEWAKQTSLESELEVGQFSHGTTYCFFSLIQLEISQNFVPLRISNIVAGCYVVSFLLLKF